MGHSRLFEPMRSADFRRLWFGQLISVVGDKINQLALIVLVYNATGSALQTGIVLAISMLPAALFGMVAGAFVDRLDHRRTMIASDLARAALVIAVPFAADHSIVLVYGIAFAVATVSLFFEPAKLSLIPDLVRREDLMAANSLDNATTSVAELLGLAAGGVLVATIGNGAFLFDAASFALSAVLITLIGHRATPAPSDGQSVQRVVAEAMEGLRYVVRHRVLRDLLPVYSVAAAGVAASITAVNLLALDRFAAGSEGLALMDAAITVGMLLGSVVVGRGGSSGAVRKVLGGLAAFAVLLTLTAVVPSVGWSVPVLLLMGAANMFFLVPMSTVLQTMTLPSMQGRAFAAKQTLTRVFFVVGVLGAGALAETIGLSPAIFVVAGLVGAAALVGWARPNLRAAQDTEAA